MTARSFAFLLLCCITSTIQGLGYRFLIDRDLIAKKDGFKFNFRNGRGKVRGMGFQSFGCWKDTWDRAIEPLEGKHELLMDSNYKLREDPLRKCALVALVNHLRMFAIENGGQCLGDRNAARFYQRFGIGDQCRDDGYGGPWSMQVYAFTGYELKPRHGRYTKWSLWTDCSKTCGKGIMKRTRNCTQPSPANGGMNCRRFGPSNQTKSCQNDCSDKDTGSYNTPPQSLSPITETLMTTPKESQKVKSLTNSHQSTSSSSHKDEEDMDDDDDDDEKDEDDDDDDNDDEDSVEITVSKEDHMKSGDNAAKFNDGKTKSGNITKSNDMTKSSDDITKSGDDITKSSDDMTKSSDDITTAHDDITKAHDGVAKSSDDITKSSDDITKSSDDMTKSTDDMTKSIDDMTKAHDDITKSTDDLTKSSDDITKAHDDITKSTDGVAKFTDDVTKPANHVVKSTDDVAKSTDDMAKSTDDVTISTHGVAKSTNDVTNDIWKIDNGISQFNDKSGNGIKTYTEDSTQANKINPAEDTNISDDMKEKMWNNQLKAAHDILRARWLSLDKNRLEASPKQEEHGSSRQAVVEVSLTDGDEPGHEKDDDEDEEDTDDEKEEEEEEEKDEQKEEEMSAKMEETGTKRITEECICPIVMCLHLADTGVLIDNSNVTDIDDLVEMKSFAKGLAAGFGTEEKDIQMGIIAAGRRSKIVVPFGETIAAHDLNRRVDGIRRENGPSALAQAMKRAEAYLLAKQKKAIPPLLNDVVFVMVSGDSDVDVHAPLEDLKKGGAKVVVIGVGKNAKIGKIASQADKMFMVPPGSGNAMVNAIIAAVCKPDLMGKIGPNPKPCPCTAAPSKKRSSPQNSPKPAALGLQTTDPITAKDDSKVSTEPPPPATANQPTRVLTKAKDAASPQAAPATLPAASATLPDTPPATSPATPLETSPATPPVTVAASSATVGDSPPATVPATSPATVAASSATVGDSSPATVPATSPTTVAASSATVGDSPPATVPATPPATSPVKSPGSVPATLPANPPVISQSIANSTKQSNESPKPKENSATFNKSIHSTNNKIKPLSKSLSALSESLNKAQSAGELKEGHFTLSGDIRNLLKNIVMLKKQADDLKSSENQSESKIYVGDESSSQSLFSTESTNQSSNTTLISQSAPITEPTNQSALLTSDIPLNLRISDQTKPRLGEQSASNGKVNNQSKTSTPMISQSKPSTEMISQSKPSTEMVSQPKPSTEMGSQSDPSTEMISQSLPKPKIASQSNIVAPTSTNNMPHHVKLAQPIAPQEPIAPQNLPKNQSESKIYVGGESPSQSLPSTESTNQPSNTTSISQSASITESTNQSALLTSEIPLNLRISDQTKPRLGEQSASNGKVNNQSKTSTPMISQSKTSTEVISQSKPSTEMGSQSNPSTEMGSQSDPSTEMISQSKPSTEVISQSKPSTEMISQSKPSTEMGSQSNPSTEMGSQSDPSTEMISQSKPSTEVISQSKPSTEMISQSKPSTEMVSQSKPSTDMGSQSNPSTQMGSQSKPSTEVISQSKPSTEMGSQSNPSTEMGSQQSKPSTEIVSQSKPSADMGSQSNPSTQMGSQSKPSTEVISQSKPSTEMISKSKPSTEMVSQSKPSTEMGRQSNRSTEMVSQSLTKLKIASQSNIVAPTSTNNMPHHVKLAQPIAPQNQKAAQPNRNLKEGTAAQPSGKLQDTKLQQPAQSSTSKNVPLAKPITRVPLAQPISTVKGVPSELPTNSIKVVPLSVSTTTSQDAKLTNTKLQQPAQSSTSKKVPLAKPITRVPLAQPISTVKGLPSKLPTNSIKVVPLSVSTTSQDAKLTKPTTIFHDAPVFQASNSAQNPKPELKNTPPNVKFLKPSGASQDAKLSQPTDTVPDANPTPPKMTTQNAKPSPATRITQNANVSPVSSPSHADAVTHWPGSTVASTTQTKGDFLTIEKNLAKSAETQTATPKSSIPDCDINLGFILDGSASVEGMKRGNFIKMINFVKDIIHGFVALSRQVHVGTLVYSTDTSVILTFGTKGTEEMIDRLLDNVHYPGQGSRTGNALKESWNKMFSSVPRGRRSVLLLLTDGPSNDDVKRPSEWIKAQKVEVFVIGLGTSYDEQQLNIIASEPAEKHVMMKQFDELRSSVQQVRNRLCGFNANEILQIINRPGYQNDADINEVQKRFKPNQCILDVAFLLDGSRQVETNGEGNFQRQISFIKKAAKFLPLSRDDVHIGLGLLGDSEVMVFPANEHYTGDAIGYELDHIRYPASSVIQARDLISARDIMLQKGMRDVAPHVFVLVTDVGSLDSYRRAIEDMEADGSDVVMLGIGTFSWKQELKVRSSVEGLVDQVVTIENVDETEAVQKLADNLCKLSNAKRAEIPRRHWKYSQKVLNASP